MLNLMVLAVLLLVGIANTSPTADIKCCYGTEDACKSFLELGIWGNRCKEITFIIGNINETTWDLISNVKVIVLARGDFTKVDLKYKADALTIINSCFSNITSKSFKDVTNITSLVLVANHGLLEERAFKDLRKLQYLKITNQSIQRLQKSFLEGPDHLKELDLNSNNMTEIDEDAFDDHQELEELNLDENPLQSFKPNLSKLLKLRLISLLDTQVKEIGFYASGHSSLYRLQIPQRALLHNFNGTTISTNKFPNLHYIGVLKKDFESSGVKQIQEMLKRYNITLEYSSPEFVELEDPALEKLWNPPSIC